MSNSGEKARSEDDFVIVAKILNPHGLRGELNLAPLTDFPDRLLARRVLFLESGERVEKKNVERMTAAGRKMITKLSGVNTREDARKLGGSFLKVPVAELHPLENGDYYHHQLIGLEVVDDRAGVLGLLDDIIQGPGGDIYSVKGDFPGSILFPGVAEFVRQVDLVNGRMLTRLPDGIVPEPETDSVPGKPS